jgi:hypothetical protein
MSDRKTDLQGQIIAQLERCEALAYGAGHHYAVHGMHAPSSKMAQADAGAKLLYLVEEYAQCLVRNASDASHG